MTLPQNVKDAVDAADEAAKIASNDSEGVAQWNLIRAHLLSQDDEIERYKVAWTEYNDRTEWVQKTAKPKELGLHRADVLRLRIESAESRLAAATAEIEQLQAGLAKHVNRVCELQSRLAVADALLSRCFVQIGELTKGLDPHDPIYVELQQLGLDWMQHSEADTAHLSENTHG